MSQHLNLFLAFMKVGGLTFGGGYAMLPMLQKEVVERHKWASEEELADWYAVGQCTPGIIAVNVATFAGQKIAGFWGAVCATIGVVTPSFLVITAIAAILSRFWNSPIVINAFAGIKLSVLALILAAFVKLLKAGVKDWIGLGVLVVAFALNAFLHISPVWLVLWGIIVGAVFGRCRQK